MADRAIAFAKVGSPGEDPFDLEGDLIDGQFRVERLVGEGELSVVYRGLHVGMNAPVAIKCLNLPQTLEPQLVEPISESFREGARVHYRLAQGHLHVVQTLALGTTLAPRTGHQIPYVVREWLDGRSLADDLAARARAKIRARTSIQAVELLESAADALAYAHAEGVCHHALSPRNLFLAKAQNREVLKVLDFGTAPDVVIQRAEAGLRLLSSHAAPEQLNRRNGSPCAATDVFAFALILFEAITGRAYFTPGAHASEMLRIANAREPFSRHNHGPLVPRDLESVLSRALAPMPRERHANLRAFWDEVKRAALQVSALQSVPPKSILSSPTVLRRPTVVEAPPPPKGKPVLAVPKLPSPRPPLATTRTAALPAPAVAVRASPLPTLAPRPSPTSCTGEVAPPVTTSALSPSTPTLAVAIADDEAAFERDTVPAPPIFEEDVRGSMTAVGSLGARWNVLATHTRAILAQSHLMAVRAGALAPLTLACVVVLFGVVVGRAPSKDPIVVAAGAPAQRTHRSVADEPAHLALSETRLRVTPKLSGFDRDGARQGFDEIASELESCARRAGPRGPGSIRVIIHPSGKIIRLQIGPPYVGTTTGDCISRRFVATALPAFVGVPQAMNYIFNTIKFSRP